MVVSFYVFRRQLRSLIRFVIRRVKANRRIKFAENRE